MRQASVKKQNLTFFSVKELQNLIECPFYCRGDNDPPWLNQVRVLGKVTDQVFKQTSIFTGCLPPTLADKKSRLGCLRAMHTYCMHDVDNESHRVLSFWLAFCHFSVHGLTWDMEIKSGAVSQPWKKWPQLCLYHVIGWVCSRAHVQVLELRWKIWKTLESWNIVRAFDHAHFSIECSSIQYNLLFIPAFYLVFHEHCNKAVNLSLIFFCQGPRPTWSETGGPVSD